MSKQSQQEEKIRNEKLEARLASLLKQAKKYISPEGELLDQSVGIIERILNLIEILPKPPCKKRKRKSSKK